MPKRSQKSSKQSQRIKIQDVGFAQAPPNQQALLLVNARLLRRVAKLAAPAFRKARSPVPSRFVVGAIFLRLHRLARSVHVLSAEGYSREAQAIARGMVNACVDMLCILEADSDARALLYALFSRQRRREKGLGYVEIGMWKQADYEKWDSQKTNEEADILLHHKGNGYEPSAKLGGKSSTWSGLSDKALIERMGRGDWYRAYYVPFSDIAHSNVMGASAEFEQIRSGPIVFGPLFDPIDLLEAIMASADTLLKALEALNKHFALKRTNQIRVLKKNVFKSLGTYSATLPRHPDAP